MIDIDYYQLLLLYRLTTSGYLYPQPALVLHFAPSLCFTLSLQSAVRSLHFTLTDIRNQSILLILIDLIRRLISIDIRNR